MLRNSQQWIFWNPDLSQRDLPSSVLSRTTFHKQMTLTFPIYWYLYKNSAFNFAHFSSARSQNFTYSFRLNVFHLFPKITVNHAISCIMRTGGWTKPKTTVSKVEGDGKLLSNEFKLWIGMKYMNIMHTVWTIDNCTSVNVGNVFFSSDSHILFIVKLQAII